MSAPRTPPRATQRAPAVDDVDQVDELKQVDELSQLARLHATLPALACLGLCEASCHTHVDASELERDRLLAAGVDLDAPTPDGACPALTRTFGAGRCSVHAIRPTICRLWGVAASMPCPHGCTPDGGHVDDKTAMRWLVTSLQLGGHHHATPAMQDLLEHALADPTATVLLGRYLRGDHASAPALLQRLTDLRTPARG